MMNLKKRHFLILSVSLTFAACSGTKGLPKGEKLYTGSSVELNSPNINKRQKKVLRSDLNGLTRPKPNSNILGLRPKLAIYNLLRNKKEKSFWGKLRSRFGEAPVLSNRVDLQKNAQLIQNYLENKGFFQAKVAGDTVAKSKTVSAKYTANAGTQYTINTVTFPADSSALSAAIRSGAEGTLLKPGSPFDLDVIKGERTRIDGYLKEQGFYFFNPDYLIVTTDSTIGANKVNMYVEVKEETPKTAENVYTINNVYVYPTYNLNAKNLDTSKANAQLYKGYYIIQSRKRFKPYLFSESMQFSTGDVYTRSDHNQTLNRLINLNIFKFVKNRFQPAGADSPKLDAYYYLTPLPAKSLRAEATATNRSNNLNGTQLTFSLLNRNLFKAGEQLNLSAYVGSDVQSSGSFKGYNTYRTGAEADLSFPRFIVPFLNIESKGAYVPRTNIKVGYDILNRKQLFTLNSYRFSYGFTWKENIQKSHELSPISITYVQPLNVTPVYDSLVKTDITYGKAIEKQFILGSTYQYNYNQLANGLQQRNAFYFNGLIDISGNLAGLITGANYKKGKEKLISGAPFAQYIKVEADGRYYRRLGLKSSWANRAIIGIGLPYGNSVQLPYVKQFFAGGNNSLRGFRSRSVGPGTYFPVDKLILPDQTGDIKLELNTELRPHIFGPLYGAFFVEAGNVWLVNDSTYTNKPGAQFTGKFLNQLAMDAGAGIRLDITLFVIRLDAAFPIRKPWTLPPYVLNQLKFNDPEWRRQNLVFNLAIGYPF